MEMRKNTLNNPGKKQAVMVDKQRVNHNSKDYQISNWPIILMAICDHYKRQGRFFVYQDIIMLRYTKLIYWSASPLQIKY